MIRIVSDTATSGNRRERRVDLAKEPVNELELTVADQYTMKKKAVANVLDSTIALFLPSN
jgi:hypothetical protein